MRTWWQPLIHLNAILNLNESLWLFICIVRAPTAATSVLFSSYLRARLYLGAGRGGVRHGARHFQIHVAGKRFFARPAQNMFPQLAQPRGLHTVLFHLKLGQGPTECDKGKA